MAIPRIDGFDIFAWVRDSSAGSLWRARQRSLDRAVLLLIINDAGDTARRESLVAAARLAAHVNQPGLVGVLDVASTPDGISYVVLDSYEGPSLLDQLAASGPLPEGRLVSIAHGIADILSRAWAAQRYVHRNLKPEDIVLLPDGGVRITGFASGTRVGDDGLLADRSGEIVGTPSYMPPEQAQARPTLDMRADMYTLGALLYHLATGHRPFEEFAADPLRLLGSLDHAQLPSPREARPELSAGFEAVLARLLMKDPQDRYNSWGGLLQDLESLAVGKPPAIAPAFVPQGLPTLRVLPAAPEPPAAEPGSPAARRRVTPPRPRPAEDEAPEDGVVERVRRRERAASGSPVPSVLWLLLFAGLGYLGYWRWQHPDAAPTVETLAALVARDEPEEPPEASALPAPDDVKPFTAPSGADPVPVAAPGSPATPASPEAAASTGFPADSESPDAYESFGAEDYASDSENPPPAPSPSPAGAPTAPSATAPTAPAAAPAAAAPGATFERNVLAAVRQGSLPALRTALRDWSAAHHDEAIAAAQTLNDCGWPDDRLGERLARHDGPVKITQGERSVVVAIDSYVGGKLRGRLVAGKDGEARPVSFAISELDRAQRWTLYRECAPEGVSTEPENHAATALYALSAGDVSAFREALPLSGGLEPVLRLVDDMIRSRQ